MDIRLISDVVQGAVLTTGAVIGATWAARRAVLRSELARRVQVELGPVYAWDANDGMMAGAFGLRLSNESKRPIQITALRYAALTLEEYHDLYAPILGAPDAAPALEDLTQCTANLALPDQTWYPGDSATTTWPFSLARRSTAVVIMAQVRVKNLKDPHGVSVLFPLTGGDGGLSPDLPPQMIGSAGMRLRAPASKPDS